MYKRVRAGVGLQAGQVVGHAQRIVAEDQPHGAVDVDVEGGQVVGPGPQPLRAAGEPADVFLQFAAVAAELLLDVVDQAVGQHVHLLEDHLVDVLVAVVAGLGEDRHWGDADGQAVFLADHLAAEPVLGLGPRVQERLRQSVAEGRVHQSAVEAELAEVSGHGAEALDFPPFQERTDLLLQKRQIGVGQEERIAAAGPRVLHGGAVAHGDLPILQHQQDGDRLAGGADAGEAGGDGRAGVIEAVVDRPGLDRPLVVEEEGGGALGE